MGGVASASTWKLSALFDLVEIPWFLATLVRRAKVHEYPESRTQTIEQIVTDAIREIPAHNGMRGHVEPFLSALAWRLQRTHANMVAVRYGAGTAANDTRPARIQPGSVYRLP